MRRRDQRDELRQQIETAQADTELAREAQAQASRQGDKVESLAQTIRERRERNHFGRDFQLTLTPRRRRA